MRLACLIFYLYDWNVWGHCTLGRSNPKESHWKNAKSKAPHRRIWVFGAFWAIHSIICAARLSCFHCARYFSHVRPVFSFFSASSCFEFASSLLRIASSSFGRHSFVTFGWFCAAFHWQIAANAPHLTLHACSKRFHWMQWPSTVKNLLFPLSGQIPEPSASNHSSIPRANQPIRIPLLLQRQTNRQLLSDWIIITWW